MDIEAYAENNKNRIYTEKVLDEELSLLMDNRVQTVVEFGCGDGGLASRVLSDYSYIRSYIAHDISTTRLNRVREICLEHVESGKLILEGDVSAIANQVPSPDLIVSEQVIEHVLDERSFLENILNICSDNTLVYISTVFITGPSYYYYKNSDGLRVLDPTHVREYRDEELIDLMKSVGFDVISEKKVKIYYPISSFINRITQKFGLRLFSKSAFWMRLPFYYNWRIIARRCSKV